MCDIMKIRFIVGILKKEGTSMSNSPFEPWAEEEMEREGLTPEEYCNENGYNWSDILVEPDYDEDD